ncbi:MAG: iron-containing alcohol dehydrogenase [Gemmiger sp.]
MAPSFAVLDPVYTLSVPPMQVMSGAFDTLSHAMETYLGNSDRDNVSDDLALAVMRNTVVNMRRLLEDMDDVQARSNLMWDSAMAENGILKCGRRTDFQAHQIEHQLGAYTDCNHGQGLAVLHPAYYRHIVKDAREKFTRLAKEVFGAGTAEAGVEVLAAFLRECGLPTRLGQLRSTVEITPELLRQVADSCNIIRCNPRSLSHEEIYQILLECL